MGNSAYPVASKAWTTAAIAAGGVPVTGSGSVIAFDQGPIFYNTPETPSATAVTFDLGGANPYTTAYLCAANSSEPSWPAGVYSVGAWNNNALNFVTFLYIDDDNIIADIQSDAAGAPATGFQEGYMSAGDIPVVGTTPVALTGMQFNYLNGKRYNLTVSFSGSTSLAAAGAKLGLYTSAGTGATLRCTGLQNVAFFAFLTASGLNGQGAAFWAAAAANNNMLFNGSFVAPNSDGVADLRISSTTAGQTTNIFDSGWIRVYQAN